MLITPLSVLAADNAVPEVINPVDLSSDGNNNAETSKVESKGTSEKPAKTENSFDVNTDNASNEPKPAETVANTKDTFTDTKETSTTTTDDNNTTNTKTSVNENTASTENETANPGEVTESSPDVEANAESDAGNDQPEIPDSSLHTEIDLYEDDPPDNERALETPALFTDPETATEANDKEVYKPAEDLDGNDTETLKLEAEASEKDSSEKENVLTEELPVAESTKQWLHTALEEDAVDCIYGGNEPLIEATPAVNLLANSYTAELSLDGLVSGTGGKVKEFTFTFKELSYITKLGSAQFRIPDGFEPGELGSLTVSAGKEWESLLDGHFVYLKALNEASYLVNSESVSIVFTAETPGLGSDGDYEFTTKAWTDNSGIDSVDINPETGLAVNRNLMANGYSDPVVEVRFPVEIASNVYQLHDSPVEGLTVEIDAIGTGFDISTYTIANSFTSVIKLETPAKHIVHKKYYTPQYSGTWSVDEWEDVLYVMDGYRSDWKDHYYRAIEHPIIFPEMVKYYPSLFELLKDQEEFIGENLDGLTEEQLKAKAHEKGIKYYYSQVEAVTDQVWFAQVKNNPGEKGYFLQKIKGDYGDTAYLFNEEGNVWLEEEGGYLGPDEGAGFVYGSDGYLTVESGSYYLGDYSCIQQYLFTTDGEILRLIDISSTYSYAYLNELYEKMGPAAIQESLTIINVLPGVEYLPFEPCYKPQLIPPADAILPPTDSSPGPGFSLFPGLRGIGQWKAPGFSGGSGSGKSTSASSFSPPALPVNTAVQTLLTQLVPNLEAIIISGFVSSGTADDLIAAKNAHEKAMVYLNWYGSSLTADQRAFVELSLALSWAAIQALEARLAAAEGETVNVAALVEAYWLAANMFAAMRDSLSEAQAEYIATILAEVAGVVAAFTE